MSELISQAEAARRFGVSPPAISKLVKSGKLPLVEGKVHMEMAAAVLAKNLDPARSKILQGLAPQQGAVPTGIQTIATIPPDYRVAKARREHHEANMAEMRERKIASDLVDRAAVEGAAYRVGRLTRDTLMAVPAKVSPDLMAANDHWDVEQILTNALRQALDDVAKMSGDDMHKDLES